MKRNITLVTMGAGNVLVLKETLKSFNLVCDEIVYGDMLLFEEDRRILYGYANDFNINIRELPFNFIYKNGFSTVLNQLANFATNDLILYMNTSEVIDENYGIREIVDHNPECNSFYFTHRTESHRWFRLYDKRDLKWHGLIHEELQGDYRPYHKPIFMMKDLEKDMQDEFKARTLNSCKECVYWNQLIRIADDPTLLDGVNNGWLQFAKETYQSMKDRLAEKGRQVEAFETGDLELFIKSASDPSFNQSFASSNTIAFQGDKIHLL